MKCTTCGYEFNKDFGICPRCGTPAEEDNTQSLTASTDLQDREKASHDEALTVCPSCGNVFSAEFEVCPACGHICTVPEISQTSDKAAEEFLSETEIFRAGNVLDPLETVNLSVQGKISESTLGFSKDSFLMQSMAATSAEAISAQEGCSESYQSIPQRDNAVYSGGLFERSEVLLDEKVSAFKFANAFRIYSLEGDLIGAVQQTNISGGAKAVRLLLGKGTKSFQKFRHEILDADGGLLATVCRDGGGFSPVRIEDAFGNVIGTFVRGQVVASSGEVLCKIKSDWKLWNITMLDAAGNTIGEIHKRWNGIAKEFFTTADKYHISVYPQVTGNTRTAVFAAALVYDILLHEM